MTGTKVSVRISAPTSAMETVSAMGLKVFPRAGQRIDRQIARNDDGDGIEDGTIDILRRGQ